MAKAWLAPKSPEGVQLVPRLISSLTSWGLCLLPPERRVLLQECHPPLAPSRSLPSPGAPARVCPPCGPLGGALWLVNEMTGMLSVTGNSGKPGNIPESFRETKTWPLSTTEEPSPEQRRVHPSPTRSRKEREPQTQASSPPAPARQPADGIAPPKLPTVPLDTRANMLCGVCSGTALSWALGTLPEQGAGLLTPPVNAGPYVLAEPAIPSLSWTQHRSQAVG